MINMSCDAERPILPLRAACSRCHALKLRCPGRSRAGPSCARCDKAGVPCVFGTSVRGKRPASIAAEGLRTAVEMDRDVPTSRRTRRAPQTHTHMHTDPEDGSSAVSSADVVWHTQVGSLGIEPHTSSSTSTSTPNILDVDVPTLPLPLTEDSHLRVVESLNQINRDLLIHATTIPPLTSQTPDITKDHEQFNLDQTFKLTSGFLDVVRPFQLHASTAPEGISVDVGTTFLAVSCWHRLADMYDCLVALVRRCAGQSVLPASREGRLVSLPPLSIGSFVPDATMSIFLQMVATLQHGTMLANEMSRFAARFHALDGSAGADLHHRAGRLHQQVRSVKSVLLETGLL
ncbi:hypothetical protein F4778DRAFT_99642 [Xylariomycetidae sp. FL2044]|nr:hypothetical protein F4778DRAFT_99642 [Xylariomycetidae sp. FL2044]